MPIPTLVADTNVLYSQVARDLLVSLPFRVVYCPEILGEWQSLFPDTPLPTTFDLIKLAPYTPVGLPDPADEAILACALQSNASVLLTFNLRDFRSGLSPIPVKHPDEFFCEHSEKIRNVYDVSFEEFTARLNRARLHKLSRKLSVR